MLLVAGADPEVKDFNGNYPVRLSESLVNDESFDNVTPKVQEVYSMQSYKNNDSLYLWLRKHGLEETFKCLVKSGYSDLPTLIAKVVTDQPLNENDLIKMKIIKRGLRLRLLYKLDEEVYMKNEFFKYNKTKGLPDLKAWLEEAQMTDVFDKLASEGFYFIEDLIKLEERKELNYVLKQLKLNEKEISKLGLLLYKLETEITDRNSEFVPIERAKIVDCGICLAFRSFFS